MGRPDYRARSGLLSASRAARGGVVEIILRAFSVKAVFPVMLAAMLADAVADP